MQGLLYTASGDQKMIDVRDYAHAREILNSDTVIGRQENKLEGNFNLYARF